MAWRSRFSISAATSINYAQIGDAPRLPHGRSVVWSGSTASIASRSGPNARPPPPSTRTTTLFWSMRTRTSGFAAMSPRPKASQTSGIRRSPCAARPSISAATNASGRRRGLGPAGSAPLERGGRDGARRRRRHRDRRVGFSTAAARQRRRAPHAPLRRGLGYASGRMHRSQIVPHHMWTSTATSFHRRVDGVEACAWT